jgi:hypothetical protein
MRHDGGDPLKSQDYHAGLRVLPLKAMECGYYLCRGRIERLKSDATVQCTARYIPVAGLDELIWQDLCQVLREPTLITQALEHARAGEWLPHVFRARQKTVTEALDN